MEKHQQSASVKSPGLSQFGQNPFRVLRMPVAATSTQAQWKAEKVLTLVRAGMPLPSDDPLPWLPDPDEIEIQEAAQKMEEPLRRLIEQLFWFDFDKDPVGDLLRRALQGDSEAQAAALAMEEPQAPARGEEPPPENGEAPRAEQLDEERVAIMLVRINQANLRLLAALAVMHGIGPRFAADSAAAHVKIGSLSAKRWTEEDGIQIMADPHKAVAKRGEDSAHPYEGLLAQALARWAAILADADLPGYLRQLIERLHDDLVTGEDTETLARAVRTLLSDILTAEIKAYTLAGRMDRTASLIRIAGKSGLDAQVWMQALKPLRYVFRGEVDDLAMLIAESAQVSMQDVRVYLTRMAVLRERWGALDESNLLGLAHTIDDGVLLAYQRIQSIQAKLSPEGRVAEHDNLDNLYQVAKRIAHSRSLKERLRTARRQLDHACEHICHFCRRREASEFPTVLQGRVETHRESHWWSNRVTIHYRIRWAVVHRCDRCANLHNFFGAIIPAIIIASIVAVTIPFLVNGLLLGNAGPGFGGLVIAVLFSGGLFGLLFGLPCGWIAKLITVYALTPRGERRYKDVRSSTGWHSLIDDGYDGFSNITIHSAKHAIDSVPKR